MDKRKTSKRHQTYLEKLVKMDLDKTLKRYDPLKDLLDEKQIGAAILECLRNNDPEGVMEMIEIYLNALNTAKLRRQTKLPKSTMYSALKHRNPTVKTLAKIMYTETH